MSVAAAAPRKVAIVGAGFSGLGAARTLLAEGRGGHVEVHLFEASGSVGGRARRGWLAAGPVELGATWWELQLVAPGEPTPLKKGPRQQAILSAFEQYSLAVEEIAEDAEAAAAAATGRPAGSALTGCSLGQVLRARFDQIQTAVGQVHTTVAAAATTGRQQHLPGAHSPQEEQGQHHHQQQQQQQKQPENEKEEEEGGSKPAADRPAGAAGQPTSVSALAAWLASGRGGGLQESFAEGWGCRERLQRAYDGFHSSDVAGLAHVTEYLDLEGPNIPVPGGYQAIAEAMVDEAKSHGLHLHFNCHVQKVLWGPRSDGKVALQLQQHHQPPAAASTPTLVPNGSDSSSSSSSSTELVFDAVVLTCSLGVLKASAGQLFDPQLPAAKADAIRKLHIGQVEKLFIEWPPATVHSENKVQQQQQDQQQPEQQGAAAGATPAPATEQLDAAPASAPPPAPPRAASAAVVGPRKPKPQQLHDVASVTAATAAAAAPGGSSAPAGHSAVDNSSSTSTSSAAGVAAPTDDQPYTTYCLMWPTDQDAWGASWSAAQSVDGTQQPQVLQMDVPAADPVYVRGAASFAAAGAAAAGSAGIQQLPEWLHGLHSWRYGDGPEWIKPMAGGDASSSSSAADGGSSSSGTQPPSRSAVIWVTGRAAQQVGQLTDEQVLQDLSLLLDTFPAIPRPDDGSSSSSSSKAVAAGSSSTSQSDPSEGLLPPPAHKRQGLDQCKLLRSTWTTSPLFRGSYSYPSAEADGGTADALAAPLSSAAGDILVCFAGEATSRQHMGTVHGAFNSGVREGERLLRSWGLLEGNGAAAGAGDAAGADAQGPAEYHAAFWL